MSRFRPYPLFFFFFVLISYVHVLFSHEFLYPVAYTECNGRTGVYVLYQKSITHLELWLWDPETKVATKGLLSTYTPAGLKILPSDKGFSFIDEGRIRIKEFHKRSPRVINIYESIYDINEIEWVNEDNFYFSAKKGEKFSIFQMDIDGILECLVSDVEHDCMYPQIIQDSLFYIERKVEDKEFKREHISYKIFKASYNHPHLANKVDKEQLRKALLNGDFLLDDTDIDCQEAPAVEKECIADFKESPISFLKMISENEGFFLAHPEEVERQDKVLTFDCCHILRNGETWHCQNIFSFSIPTYLLLGMSDSRLYESILPLLPKYHNGAIHYVDYYPPKKENLNMYRYNLVTEVTEQKSFGCHGQLFFSPICIDKTIFFGGSVNEAYKFAPKMWISNEGLVCIDLPSITLK